jgi:hypothetical protein
MPTNLPSPRSTTTVCHIDEWAQVQLWLSYSDADGNAATKYQFWDSGTDANSGYF